jgi:quinol monooxygenase YgiN
LAEAGEFVAINQFYVDPSQIGSAIDGVQELADLSRAAPGFRGTVLLQRVGSPTNVEMLTTWESEAVLQDFDASNATASARDAVTPALIAPISDRHYELYSGRWSAP